MNPLGRRSISRITAGTAIFSVELPFVQAIVKTKEHIGIIVGEHTCIVHGLVPVHPGHYRNRIAYSTQGTGIIHIHNGIALELRTVGL